MKRHATILAGTAVGLLMAAAPLSYALAQAPAAIGPGAARVPGAAVKPAARPFILAQAGSEEEKDEEEKAKRRQQREAPADANQAERPAGDPAQESRQPEAAPEPEAEPDTAPAAAPRAEEPAPRAEPAPQEEPAPEAAPRGDEPAAEDQAPRAEPQPEPAPAVPPAVRDAPAEEPAQQAEPAEPAEQPETGQPDSRQPGESRSEDAPSKEARPEPAQPEAGEPQPDGAEPRSAEPDGAGEPAEGEAQAEATPEDAPRPEPAPQVAPDDDAPEPEPRPQAPAADGDEDVPDAAPTEPGKQPEASQDEGEQPDATQPGATQPDGEQPADAGGEARPEGAAPVLDSQKEQPGRGEAEEGEQPASGDRPADGERPAGETPAPADQATEQPAEAGPPPADDSAAQENVRRGELQPVTQEEGRRIERRPEDPRRERPERAEVVREIGDRVVIRIDNNVIVESNDRPRIARGARDVYYEELPRGRTREVIVRENGVQVVTIRDRYGDVIRRSRIAPDGRETVLVYVADDDYERVRDWRDPGRDLPPMRLTIPVDEYILDAGRVENADAYYDFLDQPPVERVERLYSIDEVKRSARIRDKIRRVDLDTITFEFGSASIAESEIARLEGVAQAMERLLEENPAETFLIEGHTDAVGSDIANLALSDRRAEAVAEALTNVFAIPPENLATQGYGEQYLKIGTEEPERENRRVAIRRITPLVAPVASAQ